MMDRLTPNQRRAIRDGLIVAGLLFNIVLIVFWVPKLDLWIDARAWWTLNLRDLYSGGEQSTSAIAGTFRYAPVIAWLMVPLSWLSWSQLIAVYLALSLAAVAILGKRNALVLLVAFPPILLELLNGNIHIFMALAIWAGFRWPSAWAFILLTKVTPGVGLVWFAARREWRQLAIALGTTAGIVAIGVLIAPDVWREWIRSLAIAGQVDRPVSIPPLVVRLPVAAAMAWWAGRTDRAWLVPVACVIGMPILWLQSTAVLTACFPLWWERERWRHEEVAASPALLAAGSS
jgi:Glycosyltransferase family 87